MLAGEVQGLFCFGQNPAVGGANARLIRAGLEKLDWMVVADLFEHETASFWKRPGVDPARIPTEVFVLLAARRDMTDAPNGIGLYPHWAWVWPMNRRILYNRASVNRQGEPFNPRK
jgi:formate dehydrogenase major subunit